MEKRKILGTAHIIASINSTNILVTDDAGDIVASNSTGEIRYGRKGEIIERSKKLALNVANAVKDYGIEDVEVFVKGSGFGRKAVMDTFNKAGIKIIVVKDVTPMQQYGLKTSSYSMY